MAYLAFLLASLILFTGFIALTRAEARRGSRYFALTRTRLDAEAAHASRALAELDFAAFLRDGLRALVARIAHDIAHGSLLLVRFIERLLTRAVRALRARRGLSLTPPATPTNFVATMADFKQELRSGRKEAVPEEPDSENRI